MEFEDVEFEDVDKRIEWEARRVAAALGIREWKREHTALEGITAFSHIRDNIEYYVSFNEIGGLQTLDIDNLEDKHHRYCELDNLGFGEWRLQHYGDHGELMARGLYRLGFEDEDVLSQLPPLSMHEKLELRLSFPREFWPQKWHDEEVQLPETS